jgi:hypothetical protein
MKEYKFKVILASQLYPGAILIKSMKTQTKPLLFKNDIVNKVGIATYRGVK